LARHAPDLPATLRKDIIHAEHSDKALRSVEKQLFQDPTFKNLVGTTQAIDIIQGGVKANALPELAFAVVNHRVSIER
jgi:Gly-Xaa carboxypeptidase